jgi:hypothetical protein
MISTGNYRNLKSIGFSKFKVIVRRPYYRTENRWKQKQAETGPEAMLMAIFYRM